jgi:tetratricopeptide (TPR) repeat protein
MTSSEFIERFINRPNILMRERLFDGLSAEKVDDILATFERMIIEAGVSEKAARITWEKDLFRAVSSADQVGFEHQIQLAELRGYVLTREEFKSHVMDSLRAAQATWDNSGASVLHAATDAAMEVLNAGSSTGEATGDEPLGRGLATLVRMQLITREVADNLVAVGAEVMWIPFVRLNEPTPGACTIAAARPIAGLGGETLATAMVASVGVLQTLNGGDEGQSVRILEFAQTYFKDVPAYAYVVHDWAVLYLCQAEAKSVASTQLPELDAACASLSTLKNHLGERMHPFWNFTLATAHYKRGMGREHAQEFGHLAAIGDYDSAIELLLPLETTIGADFPHRWTYLLADAYVRRTAARFVVDDPRLVQLTDDCGKAIRLLKVLKEEDEASFPEHCRGTLARAYWTMGNLALRTGDREQSLHYYDAAISGLEELKNGKAPASLEADDSVQLARVYANRGLVRRDTSRFGLQFADDDYSEAIRLLTFTVERVGSKALAEWNEHLASAYTSRGDVRQDLRGYGFIEAIRDYGRAIALLDGIDPGPDAERFLGWSDARARAHMNRGNARQSAQGYGARAAIEDFDIAIGILSELVERYDRASNARVERLALAYMNRGNARDKDGGVDWALIADDYDTAISVLQVWKKRLGAAFPRHMEFSLACVYGSCARAFADRGDHDQNRALEDYSSSIQILESLHDGEIADYPAPWTHRLAIGCLGRGKLLARISGSGLRSPLEDLTRAHELFALPHIRVLSRGDWLSASLALARQLVIGNRPEDALNIIMAAGSDRLVSLIGAVTLEERNTLLRRGGELVNLGAVLLAKMRRPGAALVLLEQQRGMILKESLLRDPDILVERGVSSELARSIAASRQRLHELRHFLVESDGGRTQSSSTSSVREDLSFEMRSIVEQLLATVASIPDDVIGASLSLDDMVQLAPDKGLIAVPVTSDIGTVAFFIRSDGNVSFIELPKNDAVQFRDLVVRMFSLEIAGDLEEALPDILSSLWEAVTKGLAGQADALCGSGAPLTIIAQDLFDVLPLHMATRKLDGGIRYAIEDRTIRFAPGFSALQLMRRRSLQQRSGVLAGFFAPQSQARAKSDRPDLRHALLNECGEIGEAIGPEKIMAWVGPAATRERFLSLMRSDAWRAGEHHGLHLAMHSDFDLSQPDQSGLRFVDETGSAVLVTVRDLLGLNAIESLGPVCLASCKSGRSDAFNLQGEAIGLVSAFIQLGASSVLSTFFSVDDEAASRIVPRIYARSVTQGLGLADALRAEIVLELQTQQPEVRRETSQLTAEDRTARFGPPTDANPLVSLIAFKPTCWQ